MVGGCFSSLWKGKLCFYDGRINTERWTESLEQHMLPSFFFTQTWLWMKKQVIVSNSSCKHNLKMCSFTGSLLSHWRQATGMDVHNQLKLNWLEKKDEISWVHTFWNEIKIKANVRRTVLFLFGVVNFKLVLMSSLSLLFPNITINASMFQKDNKLELFTWQVIIR